MGCRDLLAGPHGQGIGIIGTMWIGPDAPYGPYALWTIDWSDEAVSEALRSQRSSNCLDTGSDTPPRGPIGHKARGCPNGSAGSCRPPGGRWCVYPAYAPIHAAVSRVGKDCRVR
jgi:hypothetical protein